MGRIMPKLVLLLACLLAGCVGPGSQQSSSTYSQSGVEWLDKKVDFVSTIRRADIESDGGFNFRVTYFQSNYKKYLVEPYASVFKIYVNSLPGKRGANIQIAMCSINEVCISENKKRTGYFGKEIYRTKFTLSDGSLDFTIPSQFIPKNTQYPRGGVFMWAFMHIDTELWRVTMSNSLNAFEVPSWPSKRFAPKYIQYKKYLELI